MSGSESADYRVIITLGTLEGELPTMDEVSALIVERMTLGEDLDDDGLACLAVTVEGIEVWER